MKVCYSDTTRHLSNKTLYIIRGLPGAGKSTIGALLCGPISVVSADDYFMGDNYEYHFDITKLNEAHKYCQQTIQAYMAAEITPIAVANTFTKLNYMRPYYMLAEKYGYNVIELTVKSGFKSVHGVPDAIVDRMRREFEPSKRAVFNYIGVDKRSNGDYDEYACSSCGTRWYVSAGCPVTSRFCSNCGAYICGTATEGV